jgi:GNAT superfamily N-acetyltransferase
MKIKITRTSNNHPDFLHLNQQLDLELAIRDGEDHDFYSQYNTINDINYIVLAYSEDEAVGCGAIKEYQPGVMEIKRMFVPKDQRRKGIAEKVLAELEKWAAELGASSCILETGFKQPEAIGLYKKFGYHTIPNYGQYAGVENSVCFEKKLAYADYYHTEASVQEYIKLAAEHDGRPLINVLQKHLAAGSSLLEIGSGPGTDWKILSEFYRVTGSDNSAEFLKHLQSTYPDGKFLMLDAVTLATREFFNGIYSNKVLHHLTDKELEASIIRQAAILTPDGIICHSFWKGEGSECFKGMFVNYQTNEQLVKAFSQHFQVLQLKNYQEFEAGDSTLIMGKKK